MTASHCKQTTLVTCLYLHVHDVVRVEAPRQPHDRVRVVLLGTDHRPVLRLVECRGAVLVGPEVLCNTNTTHV